MRIYPHQSAYLQFDISKNQRYFTLLDKLYPLAPPTFELDDETIDDLILHLKFLKCRIIRERTCSYCFEKVIKYPHICPDGKTGMSVNGKPLFFNKE